jgi:hypothetical protein
MLITRFNVLLLAAIAGGVLWIEHAHRITIEPSAPAELAGRDAAICPENESVPFSADCLAFIQGTGVQVQSGVRRPANPRDGTSAEPPELP